MPSDTNAQGEDGLRCAFNTHRTRLADTDEFIKHVLNIAGEINQESQQQDLSKKTMASATGSDDRGSARKVARTNGTSYPRCGLRP